MRLLKSHLQHAPVLSGAIVLCTSLALAPASAQVYRIETILGGFDPLEEVTLDQAWTDWPTSVAVDSSGNVYFAEWKTNRVRVVDRTGLVRTVAGNGLHGFGGDGGPATAARLADPSAIALDAQGNLYVADADNNRIRKIDASGTISTLAGTGNWGSEGDGGPAVQAEFSAVYGIAVDSGGNVYVSDTWNDRIRKIDASGTITTVAGTGEEGYLGDGGPALEARLDKPRGIAVDAAGNLFIADSENHRVRRVGMDGMIETIAGTGEAGFSGDGGPATAASLSEPVAVAVSDEGIVVIADSENARIRMIGGDGTISTVMGAEEYAFGEAPGPGTQVSLGSPRSVAFTPDADLYVADAYRDRIYRLDSDGWAEVLVGLGIRDLQSPGGVAADAEGNIFVADRSSHRVLRVSSDGTVSVFAGTGIPGSSGDGGPAAGARFFSPSDVAVDPAGNLYVLERFRNRIRKVDRSGIVSTLAGTGEPGFGGDGGPARQAVFQWPQGIAVDSLGQVYVADSRNHRIRKIDSTGTISTIAGTGVPGAGGDGGPADLAEVDDPSAIAVDDLGQVWIASASSHTVRRIDAAGFIQTVAGTGELGYGGDGGPATSASLYRPSGVAVGADGTVFVADTGNASIRRIDPAGIITTIAGTGRSGYNGEGTPATGFRLDWPSGLVARPDGSVLVSESGNHRIRLLTPESLPPEISAVRNHASRAATLAPGAIAVVRGSGLASGARGSTGASLAVSLPETLLGTSVRVTDADGTLRPAGIYSVSEGQIVFRVPSRTAIGTALVTVNRQGADSESLAVPVASVAPGLFSANGDGRGTAVASAVRVAPSGFLTLLDVARFDPALRRHVSLPIDMGGEGDEVYLTLFGTGFREAAADVTVTMHGSPVTVVSAGPSPAVHGLDQVTVGPLPRSLRGTQPEIVVIVGGEPSNAVTVSFE